MEYTENILYIITFSLKLKVKYSEILSLKFKTMMTAVAGVGNEP